jgi:hypothetical protein
MRAYVVNYTGHNLEAVHVLYPGLELVTLSEGNVAVFNTDRVVWDFRQKLLDSQPDDMLLLTGSIVLNVIACMIFVEQHAQVNLLLWHAKKETYVPRVITKAGLLGELSPQGARSEAL